MDIKYSTWKKMTIAHKNIITLVKESKKILYGGMPGCIKEIQLSILHDMSRQQFLMKLRKVDRNKARNKARKFEAGSFGFPIEHSIHKGDHIIPLDPNIKRDIQTGEVEIKVDGHQLSEIAKHRILGKTLLEMNEVARQRKCNEN